MPEQTLEMVQPAALADRAQSIKFLGKIKEFPRLSTAISNELGGSSQIQDDWGTAEVSARLDFHWLDEGQQIPAAVGQAVATICAVCQRCLEVFELPVEAPIRTVFDTPGEDDFPGYDAWETGRDGVRLIDLIEESVLMALPLAPAHVDRSACGPILSTLVESTGEETNDMVRPFAGLKEALGKRGPDERE